MSLMTLYTAEEFAEMDLDNDRLWELVRGRVQQVRFGTGTKHSVSAMEIAYAIRHYLETHPIGTVMPMRLYTTERDPDTVRIPDVSFVTRARFDKMPEWKIPDMVPDLAIEVVSPSNTAKEVAQKVAEYLARGARLVWIADPKTRTVAVHAPNAVPYRLGAGEFLDGGDVLPGFRVEVGKIFRWPPSS